jgi:hypothetical protein
MLGGVASQATASTVCQFVVARMLGKTDYNRWHIRRYLEIFPSVGTGLIFSTIASPLLITELAYPTQVSYYDSMAAKIQLTPVEFSVTKLHRCIIQCGM